MPLLENLVEGFAGAAGDYPTVNRIEGLKGERRDLAHEELATKTHQVLNDVRGIQDKIVAEQALEKPDPAKLKEYTSQLSQAQQFMTDLYHPEKNPGALQHLGGFIKQHLLRRPAAPPPATPAQAKASLGQLNAWGAGVGTATDDKEKIAGYLQDPQGNVSAAKAEHGRLIPFGMPPGMSPTYGPKQTAEKTPINLKFPDGTEISAQQDPDSKEWQYLTGEAIPPEKLRGATLSAKPGAAKGLKFDAATDEVVDVGTGRRYTRNDANAPPEVQEMFKGNTAAGQLKQKNAIELAKARGTAYGAGRYTPVIDPNNPEAVIFMTAAKAAATGAKSPASIGFQIDKAVTRAFTSGQPATAINYFNTATSHLNLLGETAAALGNGNIPLFNQWANRYAAATGSAAPNNFNTVRSAVAGELSKTFKGTGATDQEVALVEGTINNTQSPEQLAGAISYYTSLMSGKIEAMRGQYEAGKQGKPNFPLGPGEARQKAATAAGRTGTKEFSENGTIYDIPADKVDAFRKKHPNAQEQ